MLVDDGATAAADDDDDGDGDGERNDVCFVADSPAAARSSDTEDGGDTRSLSKAIGI